MDDGILIIGGYGTVGRVIASQLAPNYGNQLIIAGRNGARAATFAAELGPGVRWRVVDMAKPVDGERTLAGVRWAVMCLDLPQVNFVRQCFQRGVHYVDISAEYPVLSAILDLDAEARRQGATAVLSVGLVPGLSNLMARHSIRFVEPIEHVDIALIGGLGEKHRVGASMWVLGHLTDGAGRTRFDFHEPYDQKEVYRFAFSDQYTLPQTLPIKDAATWLGFDSFLMTHLIGLARLPALRYLFQQKPVQALFLTVTQRWQHGTQDFVLTTRACGGTGFYQAWLRGKGEAAVTGLVAAEVIRRIILQPPSPGVFHIEQLFTLEDFLPLLEQHGASFSSMHEDRTLVEDKT